MELRPAQKDEIPALTALSKAAFDTDVAVGGGQPGGPPDYDSPQWHERMRRGGHLFSLVENNELVGGLLVFRDQRDAKVMYVGRVFIAPRLHRKGYGTAAMLEAQRIFPDVRVWRLETPVWNERTNRFYPKIGYTEIKRDQESVYYQKRTPPSVSPATPAKAGASPCKGGICNG